MNRSVYIHIPFCKRICSYCDFCKFLYNKKWAYAYLKGLEHEIKDRYLDDPIRTLYIGGGTPSCLSKEDLEQLFNLIKLFNLTKLEEFTFECNLQDINEELLSILKENKVNRLSIGIESFDKNNLAFMLREANFKDAKNKIELCRKMGFNNINLDLMYAIPREKLNTLKKDLSLFLKLNPEHISTYSLIIEEHTIIKNNEEQYVAEELDYKMFNKISKVLKKYHHYELSNFAKPGYESIHNLTYWNNEEYYGFGLNAAGYIEGVRYTNTKNLKKYLLGEFIEEKEFVNKKEQMKYEMMLGLRKLEGIDIKLFKEKYDIDVEEAFDLKGLLKNKDLIKKNNHIYINRDKLYIMNEILLKII